jgi:hypothetical protein
MASSWHHHGNAYHRATRGLSRARFSTVCDHGRLCSCRARLKVVDSPSHMLQNLQVWMGVMVRHLLHHKFLCQLPRPHPRMAKRAPSKCQISWALMQGRAVQGLLCGITPLRRCAAASVYWRNWLTVYWRTDCCAALPTASSISCSACLSSHFTC